MIRRFQRACARILDRVRSRTLRSSDASTDSSSSLASYPIWLEPQLPALAAPSLLAGLKPGQAPRSFRKDQQALAESQPVCSRGLEATVDQTSSCHPAQQSPRTVVTSLAPNETSQSDWESLLAEGAATSHEQQSRAPHGSPDRSLARARATVAPLGPSCVVTDSSQATPGVVGRGAVAHAARASREIRADPRATIARGRFTFRRTGPSERT